MAPVLPQKKTGTLKESGKNGTERVPGDGVPAVTDGIEHTTRDFFTQEEDALPRNFQQKVTLKEVRDATGENVEHYPKEDADESDGIQESNAGAERNVSERKQSEKNESNTITVNVKPCEHKLSEMSYNARVKLSDKLDNNGIDTLIHHLSGKDFSDIWSACNGGNAPAFGLIYKLASSKLTTLEEFKDYAIKAVAADKKESNDLIELIENYEVKEKESILDRLPFPLIFEIVLLISPKPYPERERCRPLWKRIASEAKLSNHEIEMLDLPAKQRVERESMTEKFITIMNQRYPDQTVAWLTKGLLDLQMNDVFLDKEIFGECQCIQNGTKSDGSVK